MQKRSVNMKIYDFLIAIIGYGQFIGFIGFFVSFILVGTDFWVYVFSISIILMVMPGIIIAIKKG